MLAPLVQRMVSRNPDQRPSASEALRDWRAIRRQMYSIQRYWRMRPRKEIWLATLLYDVKAGVSPYWSLTVFCAHSLITVTRRLLLSSGGGGLDELGSCAMPMARYPLPRLRGACLLLYSVQDTQFLDIQCYFPLFCLLQHHFFHVSVAGLLMLSILGRERLC